MRLVLATAVILAMFLVAGWWWLRSGSNRGRTEPDRVRTVSGNGEAHLASELAVLPAPAWVYGVITISGTRNWVLLPSSHVMMIAVLPDWYAGELSSAGTNVFAGCHRCGCARRSWRSAPGA
jgi:hypothetical protein